MTVVKNTLARRAVEGRSSKASKEAARWPQRPDLRRRQHRRDRPAAARREKRTTTRSSCVAPFFDGEIYTGDAGMETVSKLPTREEAIGLLAAAILGPGRKLAAALKGLAARSAES